MFTNLFKTIKSYVHGRPKIKKIIGAFLVFLGLVALVTPLTPGSWLVIVGMELLGLRVLFSDKLNKLKFWKQKDLS